MAKTLKQKTTKNNKSKKSRAGSVMRSIQTATREGKIFAGGEEQSVGSAAFNIKKAERALTTTPMSSPQDSAENVLSILGVTFEEPDRDYSFLQEVTNEKLADKTTWEETKNEHVSITDKFPDETDNIFKPDKSISQAANKALKDERPITSYGAQSLASDFIKKTKKLPQIK
tara:strand:+ start:701 stop:1216 length:516 start_codon:yes stop_codon:yes gene_type:complete